MPIALDPRRITGTVGSGKMESEFVLIFATAWNSRLVPVVISGMTLTKAKEIASIDLTSNKKFHSVGVYSSVDGKLLALYQRSFSNDVQEMEIK